MVLTKEQKERIRKNRERALEIQKRRREEALSLERKAETNGGGGESTTISGKSPGREEGPPRKRPAVEVEAGGKRKEGEGDDKDDGVNRGDVVEGETLELEEFEVGASKHVTKKEAMKMYLLPEGTLAVCKFEEKQNPHNKKFQPMKLYDRAEIRRRSRERFGGLQGLIEERKRRQDKRFQKDLEETKDLFRNGKG